MPRISIGSVDLAPDQHDWFICISNLAEMSRRDLAKQAIGGHLLRWRRRHVGQIDYFAKKHGMSWEQAFRLLSDPVRKPEYTPDDIEWAKSLTSEDFWLTREDAMTSAVPAPQTDSYQEKPSNDPKRKD